MAADGTVTGTGTKWQSSLSLIRPGATIMFLSSPIQMAVVNKVVSDTEIKAITTKGAVVASTDYAILLSDSLTVDGLAQDVAETLRYYQSQETEIADAVDFFKNFDFEALQSLADQVRADSEAADASASAAAASKDAAKTSETNSKASEVAAEAARDQVKQIINDAGEQSTLVVLAQDGTSRITHAPSLMRSINLRDYLNKAPDIREWTSDSANDDTTRFQKAIAAGHNSIYIPDRAVSKDFVVGNLEITRSVKLIGDASQGIDVNGGRILKAPDADYAIHFNGQDQAGRPMGGGLYGIHVNGSISSDLGDLVRVTGWSYFKLINSSLQNIAGWGIKLRDVMESTFDQFLLRRVGSETKGGILLDDYIDIPTSNVNNLRIINGTWAGMGGPWVRANDSANVDLLWFMNNKFEWDFNPTVVNTTDKYILDLGSVARTFITHNGFTHFRPDANHNRYAGILHMGANCQATTIFENNQAFGCNGYYWNVEGGSLYARNNFSNQANSDGKISTAVTSTKHQDIEPPKYFTNNGNVSAKPAVSTSMFESCHTMYGTVNNQFISDSGAIRSTSMLVPAGGEARRFNLSNEYLSLNKAIRISARVSLSKDADGNPVSGGQIKLNVGGTQDIGTFSITGSGWETAKFIIVPGYLGTGDLRFSNPGTAPILFDGFRHEVIDFVDIGFSWSPGSIPAGSSVASPAQSGIQQYTDPGNNIAGFSAPSFNGSLKGLIPVVNARNATGSWEIVLHNPTASEITPEFSRCRVRVFI